MDKLGIPILLLAAIWGAFNVVFKAVEMMTDRRDRFQGFTSHDVGDHLPDINVKRQFFLDWLPIWLGTGAFLALFTIIIFYIPDYLERDDSKLKLSRNLCYAVAVIPLIATIAFFFGGLMDIRLFIKGLKYNKEISNKSLTEIEQVDRLNGDSADASSS